MDFDINTFIATFGIWNFVPVAITILVHIAFSAAVYSDAQIIKNQRESLVFTGPIIWSLAVLVGGILAALAYWVIHHSSLRK